MLKEYKKAEDPGFRSAQGMTANPLAAIGGGRAIVPAAASTAVGRVHRGLIWLLTRGLKAGMLCSKGVLKAGAVMVVRLVPSRPRIHNLPCISYHILNPPTPTAQHHSCESAAAAAAARAAGAA